MLFGCLVIFASLTLVCCIRTYKQQTQKHVPMSLWTSCKDYLLRLNCCFSAVCCAVDRKTRTEIEHKTVADNVNILQETARARNDKQTNRRRQHPLTLFTRLFLSRAEHGFSPFTIYVPALIRFYLSPFRGVCTTALTSCSITNRFLLQIRFHCFHPS